MERCSWGSDLRYLLARSEVTPGGTQSNFISFLAAKTWLISLFQVHILVIGRAYGHAKCKYILSKFSSNYFFAKITFMCSKSFDFLEGML
jgi:hypothetical protein